MAGQGATHCGWSVVCTRHIVFWRLRPGGNCWQALWEDNSAQHISKPNHTSGGLVRFEFPTPGLLEHRWPARPAGDSFETRTLGW